MYLRKAIRSTVVVLALSLMTGLLGYILRVLLARKLEVAEFGLFYSVMAIFLFVTMLVDAGIGAALTKRIIEYRVKKQYDNLNTAISSVLRTQVLFSLVISLLIILLSEFLSENFFHADATRLFIVLGLWVITMPLYTIILNILYGFQRTELSIGIETVKNFLVLTFSFFLLYYGIGILGPAWGYFLANAILICIGMFIVKKIYPQFSIFKRYDLKLVKPIIFFGINVFLASLIWITITQTDTLVITYFMTPSDVGHYQTALIISYILLYLTNAITTIIYPLIAELKTSGQKKKIAEGMNLIYKYLIVLLLPGALIMFVFPEILINLFFTSKYLAAAAPLRILAVTTFFVSLTQINNQALIALGKPARVAKIMVVIALINLVLNIITIPKYGIIGAAYSTLISFILATILSSRELGKSIKINYPFKKWVLLFVISIIMIIAIDNLRVLEMNVWLKFIVVAVVSLLIYFILLLLLRVLDIKEIKGMVDIIK